jgi:Bacterial regulatory helix-turn-helix protein, lysR family
MSIRTDPITLQLFISAIEEQSIAKAAEKNNIAVSAVSRRISDLELLMKVLYFFDVGESSLNVAQSSDEPGETNIAAAPGGEPFTCPFT